MRGPVGTSIKLTVRRKGKKKALEFNVKREIIEVRSVSAKIIKAGRNIGYLRLKSFNENSDEQLLKEIKNFEKNNNPVGYILDIRNNPGGLLAQAINITDFFLTDGEIVSTKGRKISETRRFFARTGDAIKDKPIIVMINNGSASASEILAEALKDHKRAIILGENTYGKGSVQSIIPLKNGGGIRLTISKYYLPSGKSISEIGVTPDIVVEEEDDLFRIDTKTDNQLDKHLFKITKKDLKGFNKSILQTEIPIRHSFVYLASTTHEKLRELFKKYETDELLIKKIISIGPDINYVI